MAKLSDADIQKALAGLQGWKRQGSAMVRVFEFPTFLGGIEFVNRVAKAAEEQQHHPDITINYNQVTMVLSSHDAGGITERDIRMARTIDGLRS